MSDASAFTKLVPGFDFLQGLVKNAGAALPGIGQWVAPTLNPEELEKRIEELRTVQFWLEQNARMIGATIQALEVQRMTLSTLKTMNVQMGDLRDALKIRVPEPKAEPKAEPKFAAAPSFAPAKAEAPEPEAQAKAEAADDAKPGAVDPMQWWGALTKQFTELATAAMKDSAAATAAAASRVPAAAPDSTPPQAAPAPARAARKAAPAAARKKPAAR